ncbi:nucleotide sugar dehydrogenase [Parasphingorhabdus cellanae]|uniref:Nucleotide sugar dehydrogenase n=1 Tax=Parasphingorhabdus cellanae TaxID=2806553 RepID=A0ABX7SZZ8_9SPHN|nr:nucleotide sugar dehydrogenase [Parasphingorhabdus cellanae]QTD54850.1 nucleotide sugar dehydrogenase [Parasphingorhabdus cellanae]
MQETIVVLGLGYVGLPVAVALSKEFDGVVGFDTSLRRVESLQSGHDWTGEISDDDLSSSSLSITNDPDVIAKSTFLIVTVPTPIDAENRPDLDPIRTSCEIIGRKLRKGSVVVFESTVYPGVTEDICGPLLEKLSGLKRGEDFFLGYSPERINPGDKVHRLETITKIVAAENDHSLERVKSVYGPIIEAGLHVAPTIKVAEAAKVIENTQRDLNIALMNELALIFDLLNIDTSDVLKAAGTKWNFLPFTPGLVGGHCIGVDPYYLTSVAEKAGYRPEVILAGRRINNSIASYVAQKTVKMLTRAGHNLASAKIGIFGLTFKPDVPDIRNSKVPNIVRELEEFGIVALVHDPLANPKDAKSEYQIDLCGIEDMGSLDAIILAVAHDEYKENADAIKGLLKSDGVILEVMPVFDRNKMADSGNSWRL